MKMLLISIATFAVGALGGFFAAKKIYEVYYNNLADEEIESVKESYERRMNAIKKNDTIISEKINEITEKVETVKDTITSINNQENVVVMRNPYEKAKTNYNIISTNHEEEDTDEDVATGETRDISKIDRMEPYVITDDEFLEDFNHHDKVSLYYYRLDDVLCEENEEPIDDIDRTVGWKMFKVLDMQDTAWVRNEKLGIDYEIIAIRKSFVETVHGIGIEENLTPRERKLKQDKLKRRKENES